MHSFQRFVIFLAAGAIVVMCLAPPYMVKVHRYNRPSQWEFVGYFGPVWESRTERRIDVSRLAAQCCAAVAACVGVVIISFGQPPAKRKQ